jgi:polyhydroxyalkanoate synthase
MINSDRLWAHSDRLSAGREKNGDDMADGLDPAGNATALPSLEEMQHWTWVLGRAQQLMLEHTARQMTDAARRGPTMPAAMPAWSTAMPSFDTARVAQAQADLWSDSIQLWQRFVTPDAGAPAAAATSADHDRRFGAPEWRDHPVFDLIRQSYLLIADHLLRGVDALDTTDPRERERLRFATNTFVEAMSPSNFPLTNPLVLAKTIETRGHNLLTGLERMLGDLQRGQLTHTDPGAFEVGRNIAVTPGKVIKETPLYQLIQYEPATPKVFATPLVIFPPWINRYYILDLNPEKSFIRWAVEQGLTVFIVSWKSADETMVDTNWDDYVLRGQIDAIDTVCALLDVPAVNAIGYCVAGTTLAATLALLTARGEAAKVASATFFTAQVDFSRAGDLNLFVNDDQLKLIETLSAEKGYMDGRYMALTFNLLRGRDLIWNYVVNNYMLGEDYAPFDLLHWNGDTTNLPARWHQSYLRDLYRDNKLVQPGGMTIDGTPIDLSTVATPSYVQAGREDHIAPAESVWKLTEHFTGPMRFVLAASGHIAGVVNPPSSGKYQYWTSDEPAESLAGFIDRARATPGSWWPDWLGWVTARSGAQVPAKGARIPGKGALPTIEPAPGRYATTR